MAHKSLCRHGWKAFRMAWQNDLRRMSTSDGPCPPPPPPPQPTPSPQECCPLPLPCPPKPTCPPTMCPPNPDPNNPCNYCPPPCPDPDYPDITRVKRLQCKFQEDNGLPVYLKSGKMDVILYHSTVIMVVVGLGQSFYGILQLILK